ncbi:MAG: hypothetical protein AB1454_12425 [Candidatus Auribacterota bacterium]
MLYSTRRGLFIVSSCIVFALFFFFPQPSYTLDNGYELSEEFIIVNDTSNLLSPLLVTNNGTNYFSAWQVRGSDNGYGPVYALLINQNGTPVSTAFQIKDTDKCLVCLESNGTSNLFIFKSDNDNDSGFNIYGQYFDNEGAATADEFFIYAHLLSMYRFPYLTSNGNEYLLTSLSDPEMDNESILGIVINGEDSVIVSIPEIPNFRNFSVVSDGIEFLILGREVIRDDIFISDIIIHGYNIDNEGNILNESLLRHFPYYFSDSEPIIASNGDNYLLVWSCNHMGYLGLYYQPIDKNGSSIRSETLFPFSSSTSFSVSSNGKDYLIVWVDEGIRGQFIASNGYPLGSSFQISSCQNSNKLNVHSNEKNFLVSWKDYAQNKIIGNIVRPKSSKPMITEQPESATTYIGEDVSFEISAYSNEGQVSYQWYINSDLAGNGSNFLIISNPTIEQNNSVIYCDISDNNGGLIRSADATLTVLEPAFQVAISGPMTVFGGDTAYFSSHALYGQSPDFEEYDVTNYVVWEILDAEPNAEFISPGVLKTYPVTAEKYITIRATLTDGDETHWSDFDVLIDDLFTITGISPSPDSILTSAPNYIDISFSEAVDNDSITPSACCLIKAGRDQEFDTSDDSYIPLFYSLSPDQKSVFCDLTDSMLPNDLYKLKVSAVTNKHGTNLDGEFTGALPSGNGQPGGVFESLFTISRQVISLVFNDNDTVTILWEPFREPIVYRVEQCDTMDSSQWLAILPAEQWPIEATQWTGGSWSDTNHFYRVVGVAPYILSVAPSEGTQGTFSQFVDIIGYGTKWENGNTSVTFGNNIAVNSLAVLSHSYISVEIRISFTAQTGFRDIIVTSGTNVYIKEDAFEVLK